MLPERKIEPRTFAPPDCCSRRVTSPASLPIEEASQPSPDALTTTRVTTRGSMPGVSCVQGNPGEIRSTCAPSGTMDEFPLGVTGLVPPQPTSNAKAPLPEHEDARAGQLCRVDPRGVPVHSRMARLQARTAANPVQRTVLSDRISAPIAITTAALHRRNRTSHALQVRCFVIQSTFM